MGLTLPKALRLEFNCLSARGVKGGGEYFRVILDVGGASGSRRLFAWGVLALIAALAVGLCVETAGEVGGGVEGAQQFVRRSDASMAGATMAILIEGAPSELAARFDQSLDAAAARRQIALAPPTAARYLVRGYLSAAPAKGGATVDFVWDVFTPDKHRASGSANPSSLAARGTTPGRWLPTLRSTASQPSARTISPPICRTPRRPPPARRSATQNDAFNCLWIGGRSRPPVFRLSCCLRAERLLRAAASLCEGARPHAEIWPCSAR